MMADPRYMCGVHTAIDVHTHLLRDGEVNQSCLGLDLRRIVRIGELGVQEQPGIDRQRDPQNYSLDRRTVLMMKSKFKLNSIASNT